MKITNFTEARQALSQFASSLDNYTLDNIRVFMEFLGNPQDSLKIIHVAGTSGKTSTCYYIAGLLKASGKTVGLTVSPHIDEINERVQINLLPLPEASFCKEIEAFLDLVTESKISLSYFEVMVAFAYWYFAKIKVDYAVIEVGLGGRIDGTNVVNRPDKVCVITNIGLDHTHILGDTLPKIAAEKAGIITDANQVFTHDQADEVLDVIRQKADIHHAILHIHSEQKDARLSALPLFQQHNFGLAIEVVKSVLAHEGQSVSDETIAIAANTYVPARMEIVRYDGRTIVMDGAHNGQKMRALLSSMKARYPDKSIGALVAFVATPSDRIPEVLSELFGSVDTIIATEFSSEQDSFKKSVTTDLILSFAREHDFQNITACPDSRVALDRLLAMPEDILLITGSFYLLNHIRPLIMKS